jgi:hypothetical protein
MAYEKLGGWAFFIGVVIAILSVSSAPLTQSSSIYAGYVTLFLVLLGLVVGFINIAIKDSSNFLIASIAVILLSTTRPNLEVIPLIGRVIGYMVVNVAAFVAPAALVVGLKSIYFIASKPAVILASSKK